MVLASRTARSIRPVRSGAVERGMRLVRLTVRARSRSSAQPGGACAVTAGHTAVGGLAAVVLDGVSVREQTATPFKKVRK
ncbi:hypothetical protein GCM10010211_44220 [Streptomyces albospinus]|uniref:Uncharacterized protein n=1 Tax=Streptomyces albospinus TaxID=285515 RepID=A0ABQ2V7Z3_9ACTN|nr:hypothetical protein GCM10010211_44220 [Streptomyces albospinus]